MIGQNFIACVSKNLPRSQALAKLPVAYCTVKPERAWYISSRDIMHGQGKLCERGRHINHKNFTRTHALKHNYSKSKIAAHEGTFMLLFMRQLGEQAVLPSQDSEVKTHSNNLIVLAHVQLKPSYHLSTCDITYLRKYTRPSPALPYCKQGPGNETIQELHCVVSYTWGNCR